MKSKSWKWSDLSMQAKYSKTCKRSLRGPTLTKPDKLRRVMWKIFIPRTNLGTRQKRYRNNFIQPENVVIMMICTESWYAMIMIVIMICTARICPCCNSMLIAHAYVYETQKQLQQTVSETSQKREHLVRYFRATMFNLPPIYSAHKPSNHKYWYNFTENIHKHQTQNVQRISPFSIASLKKACKARTWWYRG